MDFITIFLESQGCDAIFVVVDCFKKLEHIKPIQKMTIVFKTAVFFSMFGGDIMGYRRLFCYIETPSL